MLTLSLISALDSSTTIDLSLALLKKRGEIKQQELTQLRKHPL